MPVAGLRRTFVVPSGNTNDPRFLMILNILSMFKLIIPRRGCYCLSLKILSIVTDFVFGLDLNKTTIPVGKNCGLVILLG